MTFYNNLPQITATQDSSQATLKVFDAYAAAPLNINATTYDAMVGFFNSKGFGIDSSKSMAYIIIKQAILDNINPFTIIDTLRNQDSIELSALVTQIVNYNRYKTSSLGTASTYQPADEIARNIVA